MLSQFFHSTEWVMSFQCCLALMYLHCYSIQCGCASWCFNCQESGLALLQPIISVNGSSQGWPTSKRFKARRLTKINWIIKTNPWRLTCSFNSGCFTSMWLCVEPNEVALAVKRKTVTSWRCYRPSELNMQYVQSKFKVIFSYKHMLFTINIISHHAEQDNRQCFQLCAL